MPLIDKIDGISILIFPKDHNPPHIHVHCAGQMVSIQIKTLKIVGKMQSKTLKKATKWIEDNQLELLNKWENINGH